MSKVKVKKIKIPIGMQDEGLAEMFNQMLGAGSVNMTIAYPRYLRIKALCEQLIKIFEMLVNSPFMKIQDFAQQRIEIETFCRQSRASANDMFKIDFSDYEWNLELLEDEQKKAFTTEYEKMKKSNLVKTFVIMCDKLVVHKKNFIDINNLKHKFIINMPGAEFTPFPFTNLNLKYIFSLANVGENTIRFFMTILHKSYELSHELWKETSSPDIDVDQFVDVIMSNIGEIQKRPELSRCGKAFQKIKDSVHMLKNRFNGYYRDFISTGDSTIMMQNFIIDVSTETKADPSITAQFRTIIGYYRKIAQDQINNPKIKKLFEKVNESFKELETGTNNLVKVKDDNSDKETDSENEHKETEDNESDSDAVEVSTAVSQTELVEKDTM